MSKPTQSQLLADFLRAFARFIDGPHRQHDQLLADAIAAWDTYQERLGRKPLPQQQEMFK